MSQDLTLAPYRRLGDYLKQLRGPRKQADIAAQIRVTQSTYNRIERGYRLPSDSQLERLSQVLDVELSRLRTLAGYDIASWQTRSKTVGELQIAFATYSLQELADPPGEGPAEQFVRGWRRHLAVQRAVAARRWHAASQDADWALTDIRTAADGLECYLLVIKSRAEMRQGNPFAAEAILTELRARLTRITDRNALGQFHLCDGELARSRGNWREALECFRRALVEFDSLDAQDYAEDQHALVLRKMAVVYLEQGLWQDARARLEGSWNHFDDTEDLYEQAKLHMAMGWYELYKGNIERSVSHRADALSLASGALKGRDLYLLMQANLYYALSLRERGGSRDREIALEKLAAATRLAHMQGLAQPPTTIALGIAQIHLDQLIWNDRTDAQWDSVVAEIYQVVTGARPNRLEESYAFMLLGIAEIERDRALHRFSPERFEAALDKLDRAIRHFTRRDQRAYLAEALYLKAYYLMRDGLFQVLREPAQGAGDPFGAADDALNSAELAADLRVPSSPGYPMMAPRIRAMRIALDLLVNHFLRRSPAAVESAPAQFVQAMDEARTCGSLTVQHVRRLQTATVSALRRGR